MILLNHWRVLSLCVCRLVCKFSAAWILIHRFTRKSHQFFRSKSHHSVSLLDPWKLIPVSQYCTKVKTSDALFFFAESVSHCLRRCSSDFKISNLFLLPLRSSCSCAVPECCDLMFLEGSITLTVRSWTALFVSLYY